MKENEDWVRQSALFSELSEEEISVLGRRARKICVEAGRVLVREGEVGRSLFIILSGSVRIVRKTPTGREQTIALLRAGEVFGEMSLLDDAPRSATAVANGPATLLQLSREDLDELARLSPGAEQRLMANGMRLALKRLRATNDQFLELAQLGAKVRSQIGQMRSHILTLVSHEFRTPLTVIKSSAQLLRRSGDTSLGNGFLEKIERQSAKMQQLVDDLITVSTLRARPWLQNVREFDIVDVLDKALDALRWSAEEKEVRVRVLRGELPCRIRGDSELLSRAIYHLAATAVELSPPGAEVRLEAEPSEGGGVRLQVLGCGQGLGGETARHLAELLSPKDSVAHGEKDGLGIGWTLARQVAAAHGGAIEVSKSNDQGLCLCLQLPLEPEAQLASGAAVSVGG